MTQKTNNNSQSNPTSAEAQERVVSSHMTQDLKNAVLIVSVVANLFILSAWIALQVTSQYDVQLSNFLFTR
jgi:hypothetical protein